MTSSVAAGTVKRRSETLADRQARVGIVANPKRVPVNVPVPRDVWARWPDLRSAHRRKSKTGPHAKTAQLQDMDAFEEFVRSVRKSPAMPSADGVYGLAISRNSGRRLVVAALAALGAGAVGYGVILVALRL
ncbi:MAG: hypothetical protein JXQ79_12290 [Rhodobacteraceae bacterium]|nr:hypothetical protein [Paracoccaceae bacterium]